ncbi:MAG: hypothetical protein ABSD96_10300 [Candidatus Korobacteraceae bacterium]|jgi:hypothetical protein
MEKGRKVRIAFSLLAAVFTVLFVLVLSVDLMDLRDKRRFNAALEELRSEVKRELPAGSSRTRVESFLKDRAIEPGAVSTGNEIFGLSQTSYSNLISKCRIQLVFRFGEDGRLRDSKVYEACSYL